MHVIEYKYLRALELDRRHPFDVGGWQTLIMRLELGEGIPPPEVLAGYPLLGPDGRLAPAPKFKPGEVEMRRSGHYHRVIGSKHVVRSLKNGCHVATNIYLFPSWAKPEKGYIPLPRIGEQPLVITHNVLVVDHHPGRKQFKFENWWGPGWGLNGNGIFDYAYVDHYCFDSWVPIYFGGPVVEPVARHYGNAVVYRWKFFDGMGNRNHGIGYERRDKTRLAWAFMVERNGALEVQELYVWETFRQNGLGTHLAGAVKKIARERGLPLRLFVSFSDAQRESPQSYLGMVKIVKRLGLRFHRCPVPWSAYYATNELTGGAEEPIEPVVFPSRPKSTLEAVLVAASMIVSPDVRPQVEVIRNQVANRRPVNEVVQQLEQQDIKAINRRRSQLIWKRYRDGSLPEAEAADLERLQNESLRRGLEHQPPPKITPEQLAYIEEKLANP